MVVDSWNNIKKYVDIENAFFIFDEQRVVGSGAWVKAFLKIAKNNRWILLSATPGDTWIDYVPVFIANGFYKNRSEFIREHVIYNNHTTYPKIDRYINTGRLIRLRNNILVDMDFARKTEPHHEDIYCDYDITFYKDIMKTRFNPYTNDPIINAGELCYTLRKAVNSSDSRQLALLELVEDHPRIIPLPADTLRDIMIAIAEFLDVVEKQRRKDINQLNQLYQKKSKRNQKRPF